MNRRRICTILIIFATMFFYACEEKEVKETDGNNNVEAITKEGITTDISKESTQNSVTASGVNQNFTVNGLDFDSTEADVMNKLGKPVEEITAAGISINYYGSGFPEGNSIAFINGTISSFKIRDNTWNTTEGNYYNKKYNREHITLNESDIGLTVSQAIKKFGYPDEVYVFSSKYYYFIYIDDGRENTIIFWGEDLNSIRAKAYKISNGNWIFMKNIKIGDGLDSCFTKLYLPEEIRATGVKSDDSKAIIMKKLKSKGYYENYQITFDNFKGSMIDVIFDVKGNAEYISWAKYDHPEYNIQPHMNSNATQNFDKNTLLNQEDAYLSGCDFDRGRAGILETFGNPNKALMSFYDKFGCGFTYFYDDFFIHIASPFYGDIDSLDRGVITSYTITGTGVAGFRGLQVGDDVNKVLDVVPCNNTIDFNRTGEQYIYSFSEPDNEANPDRNGDTYSGKVESEEPNSGRIIFDFNYWDMYCNYADGKITEIGYHLMLD